MRGKKVRNPKIEAIETATKTEAAAVEFMEAQRWGDNPACPRCGSVRVYRMKDRKTGERNRHFRWRCRDCKRMHTVRTATVMESSRLPLTAWVYAFWKACASKEGIAALQLQRELDINYKSALCLLNRIRFAMTDWPGEDSGAKVGAGDGTVEAEETYIGWKPRCKDTSSRGPGTKKTPVFAMVERGGRLRVQLVEGIMPRDSGRMADENLNVTARLITDDLGVYGPIGRNQLGGHEAVKHDQGEYVYKSDPVVHSNTVESAFCLSSEPSTGLTIPSPGTTFPATYESSTSAGTRAFPTTVSAPLLAVKGAEEKRPLYWAVGT